MSEKLIRTFLSIPVPLEVRSKKNMLYSTLEESPAKINWVKNVQLHLTIKFLSHTPESIIEKIINEVGSVTSTLRPFEIIIESTGCFPIKERPRVLKQEKDFFTTSIEQLKKLETIEVECLMLYQ